MKLFALIILLVLPVLAVATLCLHGAAMGKNKAPDVDLTTLIPTSYEGWQVEDLPLGISEAQSESALKTLALDSFVQRKYSKNGGSITVYVAYWKPGKMDTRLVATHNPDICWKANGWTCSEAVNRETLEVGAVRTKPAEYRVYEIGGKRIRVFFWLTVNGGIHDFAGSRGAVPNPITFFKRFFHDVFAGKPEHYFVRITSDLPKDRMMSNPLFAELIQDLKKTGIAVSQ